MACNLLLGSPSVTVRQCMSWAICALNCEWDWLWLACNCSPAWVNKIFMKLSSWEEVCVQYMCVCVCVYECNSLHKPRYLQGSGVSDILDICSDIHTTSLSHWFHPLSLVAGYFRNTDFRSTLDHHLFCIPMLGVVFVLIMGTVY